MYNLSLVTTFSCLITIGFVELSTHSPVLAATPQEIARQITVRIEGKSNRGSGVIVSRDGSTFAVLTNAHVVNRTGSYRAVTTDGVSHQIDKPRIIPNLDLALLSFTSNNNYAVASVDNTLPSTGDTIYVAGWPRSGSSLRQPIFKVTSGEIRQTNSSLPLGYNLTYTNLVRAGMSGGAILNTAGKLIGINGLVRLDTSDRPVASGIAIDTFLQWRGSTNNTVATTDIPNAVPERVARHKYILAKTLSLSEGGVNALVYNAASQTIISGSSTGTIAIWQAATKEQLLSWQAHPASVNAIALSRDGKTLASGGDDGTISIWDLRKLNSTPPKLLHTLKGHTGSITDLVFGADNNTLFSSSWDTTIRQWQIDRAKAIETFTEHTQIVNAIALSRDNKTLASGGQDRVIRLWDVSTGNLRTTLPGHSLAILSLDISANGKTLVSGGGDGTIKLWNLQTNELVNTLQGHTDGVWQVAISSNLQTLFSGSWDKTIKVWNLKTGTLQDTLAEHKDYIGALILSPDGKMSVSGDWQGQICLWQLKL